MTFNIIKESCMKRISWVVMSALVMGFSVSAMQESEEINPNRKRRVSPCCNLGRLAAGIMVAFVGFSNQIRGVQAQSQVTVVDPNVNFSPTIPADVIAGQAEIQEIADEVRCYDVDGFLVGGKRFKLRNRLCHKPNDEEQGRLKGHIEQLAHQVQVLNYDARVAQLNVKDNTCPIIDRRAVHEVHCIKKIEQLKADDLSVWG